jgi:periplasmic protein TonB
VSAWRSIVFLTCLSSACDVDDDLSNDSCVPGNSTVYIVVEQPPVFEGCNSSINPTCNVDALKRYLFENIVYPTEARNIGAEGVVQISCIVEKSGCLSNIMLVKRVGYGCDEEALRVVRAMPLWLPGRVNGNPERVAYFLNVEFALD